ncbi:DUF6318 family protein [Pseudarthrobacter sp. N5]|uniref:DUF6318 family protein n=1 Tax=Pseudarthrobacter sp. N5 TaxID=3418416 RepID=UPI003CEB0317
MTTRLASTRFRLAGVAALAACALTLSACQGGGTPGNTGTTTASVTPSATPTPTPTPIAVYKPADAKGKAQNVPVPVKPALADENSKAGLEAFTKYWFALLNYGFETGDSSAWEKLIQPGCLFCENLKSTIETGYKLDRWQAGGRISAPIIDATVAEGAPTQQVMVQVIQETTDFYKADGSIGRAPEPASNTASVVIASYKDGAWIVSDMHLVQ